METSMHPDLPFWDDKPWQDGGRYSGWEWIRDEAGNLVFTMRSQCQNKPDAAELLTDTRLTDKKINKMTHQHLDQEIDDTVAQEATMMMLLSDIRITDARLSGAIDHEEGLRALHATAVDRVVLLRLLKRDLQAKAYSPSTTEV